MDPDAALQKARDIANEILTLGRDREGLAVDLAYAVEALDGWLTKGGFLPDAWERKIDVIHTRDPDSECGLMVYVNGVRVEFKQWSFDPGAGYEMDEFEENKREDMDAAPEYLKPFLEEIYDEMEPTYRRWSL